MLSETARGWLAKKAWRPSWRALQALTLTSVVLCLVVVYDSWCRLEYGGNGVRVFVELSGVSVPHFHHFGGGEEGDKTQDKDNGGGGSVAGAGKSRKKKKGQHPIDLLIEDAQKAFKDTLATTPTSLNDAAEKYRKRRKRHPPPGFDTWYAFSTQRGAILPESFFDTIYHDLGPYWGLAPHTTRSQAHALRPRIQIRNNRVTLVAADRRDTRARLWMHMLSQLANTKHVELPDIDLPININQEPGVAVGWEKIDTALSFARPLMAASDDVLGEFSGLEGIEKANFTFAPEWLGARLTHSLDRGHQGPRPYWSLVQSACPPKTPGRMEDVMVDIWSKHGHVSDAHKPVNLLTTKHWPNGSLEGYVANWTAATDPCQHPNLQGLHGAFVQPESMATSQTLFPFFSGAKMGINNDILLPSPLTWNATLSASAATQAVVPWANREPRLFWRGQATGGHNTKKNWRRFQRHRFVSMLNSSQISLAENSLSLHEAITTGLTSSETFRLPETGLYNISSARGEGRMGEWVKSWADIGFTDLRCDEMSEYDPCPYNSDFFAVRKGATAEESKYTVALDGNADDGTDRFVEGLRNGNVVLRASVFRNWFDARLTPWVHYVPMDNTFMDVYGIMNYFVGKAPTSSPPSASKEKEVDGEEDLDVPASPILKHRNKKSGHDEEAEKIAAAGKEWADKVLRKEDMLIYAYRLLLEFARIGDDRRERLGWVEDLNEEGS